MKDYQMFFIIGAIFFASGNLDLSTVYSMSIIFAVIGLLLTPSDQ